MMLVVVIVNIMLEVLFTYPGLKVIRQEAKLAGLRVTILYPLFVTALPVPMVPVNGLVVMAGVGFNMFVTHNVRL